MLTQVKTPQEIFFNPQRLLVPLFQRPYVWSQEGQWAPLWDDIRRVAGRVERHEQATPHFLGAVVLQQQQTEIGTLGVRTIIDGQQRLTTLQLFLDAVHDRVQTAGFENLAKQVLGLVQNPVYFTNTKEDEFKVWPTNRDRAAFNEVMSAPTPVDYTALKAASSRMALAHKFFSGEIGAWLEEGDSETRATALVQTISNYLQIVVIDLQVDEDAQEIFETLNARGTPLTAADLIKNFVFQRLEASPAESEKAYRKYWEEFETPFWEKEVSAGRILYSRSSLFLTQWLVSKTLKDVPAREVFSQFKHHVTDASTPVDALLPKVRESAGIYRDFTEGAAVADGPLNRVNMFVYRTATLDSEVVKPLLLWLLDPELAKIPGPQLNLALVSLESWLVRRAFVRGSTKAYNRFIVDMMKIASAAPRETAGTTIRDTLARQDSPNTYWPGDAEIRRELKTLPIYRRFARGRLRMVLEAIEDHRRGFDQRSPLDVQRVVRGACTIEHVMPQEWRAFWPGAEIDEQGVLRDDTIQTLGNLTLITQALNSKVSNGAWEGEKGKKKSFSKFTTLLLTRQVCEEGEKDWDDERIHARTVSMIDDILQIWPVPVGHFGVIAGTSELATYRVTVSELVRAGLLSPGQDLFARVVAKRGERCQISEDGGIFLGEERFETLSAAARAVTGNQSEGGWWFWLVDMESDRCLSDVRQDYLESLNADAAVQEELQES
ncbi:DUF262 domain-containing protein [Alpinimonas psychrophila]|uniref:DUF262 domain-containing protein n=1 Tax=Alpinimonas psychrophila TaxID=748908 RepID=A0A7W3JT16_9MICO|nr:DUF262 domain-containing protein [Alpinimonas psychrophila]MBA8828713.1 hypothetical protein [Alpinimonas psychrophila]